MRIILFLIFLLVGNFAIAQSKYWVKLNDKNHNDYSLAKPLEFLTQKSIDRRKRQGIELSESDLPISQYYLDQVKSTIGVEIVHFSKWLNSIVIVVENKLILDKIESLPFVSEVRLISGYVGSKEINTTKNNLETGFDEYYGIAAPQIKMHNLHYLHKIGFQGEGMMIAVLDGGFNNVDNLLAFEKLRNDNRIIATKDVVGNGSVYAHSGHGTAVLSCMAGYLPSEYVGSAPMAEYILIRTEDVDSEYLMEEDNWVVGAEFADSLGADVLNTSLGYTEFDDSLQNHVYSDMDGNTTIIAIAADIAAAKGMLVVTSAGNNGKKDWFYISTPADADSTLTVGAVSADSLIAPFSSRGPSADGDIKPNVVAIGKKAAVVNDAGVISLSNGTSFSGPIMAGAVACFWQSNPNLTNMEVIRLIEKSSDRFISPTGEYGYGIPNLYKAYSNFDDVELKVELFPNPCVDELNLLIASNSSIEGAFEILDLRGQIVFRCRLDYSKHEEKFLQLKHPISKLAVGSYNLKIDIGGTQVIRRLVKVN